MENIVPLIKLNNPDYQHFSICYVDNLMFPHAGSPVLLDVKHVNSKIKTLMKIYGKDSLISKQHLIYENSNPQLLERLRDLKKLSIQNNEVCLTVEKLIENSDATYDVRIDLSTAFNFNSKIPREKQFLILSENLVKPVEAWVSEVQPEIENSTIEEFEELQKIDKTHYYLRCSGDSHVKFKLLDKLKNLVEEDIYQLVYKNGFFNLDLIAIKHEITEEVINQHKEVNEKENKKSSKNMLQDMIDMDFHASLNPLSKIYAEIYDKIEQILVENLGDQPTMHIRSEIAQECFSSLYSFDIFVEKTNES